MRRVQKTHNSQILEENLRYIIGNSANNKRIAEILLAEQKEFCAYTEEFISRTDARDIDHFNPTLKGTNEDNYDNWFLIKHQWNKEKSYKWEFFQPVLHPTAIDLEDRIIYSDGDFFTNFEDDVEANNLIKLLKLDDVALAEKRKKYISRKREELMIFGQDTVTFFTTLIEDDKCQICYLRAIREEFNIDLWELLN